MNHEHFLAFVKVRQVYVYLSVKTSGTQQGRVEHVGAVGGGQRDDAAVGAEAVHLGEQGVQRVLALVVSTHGGVLRTGSTHGINLVDEDDAGCFRLGFVEQIAYARSSNAHEHFDEVATRHREERHTSLAGNGLGQQRLSGSRRSYEQCALGNLTTQLSIFLRVLQEVYDFLHLLLGSGLSGNILEGDTQIASLLIHLCLRLAYVEDASTEAGTSTAAHAAHEEHPYGYNEEYGQEIVDERSEETVLSGVLERQLAREFAFLAL